MLFFLKTSKTNTAHGYLLYAHSKQTKSTQKNPTQKTPNTAHCKRSVKQTAQRAEKVVEHTVPDKNRSGALNAMRSTPRETKDTRDVERATRDETETLRTGSRAIYARRNGNGTSEPRKPKPQQTISILTVLNKLQQN